jgi:hypothetical protein
MQAHLDPARQPLAWPVPQANFLLILPRIALHGRVYFRHKNPGNREELVAEMVSLCWRWSLRLVQRGKGRLSFPLHGPATRPAPPTAAPLTPRQPRAAVRDAPGAEAARRPR